MERLLSCFQRWSAELAEKSYLKKKSATLHFWKYLSRLTVNIIVVDPLIFGQKYHKREKTNQNRIFSSFNLNFCRRWQKACEQVFHIQMTVHVLYGTYAYEIKLIPNDCIQFIVFFACVMEVMSNF